jgi:hypothetical protein
VGVTTTSVVIVSVTIIQIFKDEKLPSLRGYALRSYLVREGFAKVSMNVGCKEAV